MEGSWADLPVGRLEVPPAELSLPHTLDCGQAFRWRQLADGWWHGGVAGRAIRLQRAGDVCLYQVYPAGGGEALLRRYLRLDVALPALVADLAARDAGIRPALAAYPGLRLLAQEPEETLLSYLCSTANSVVRISRSLAALSVRHGQRIARLDGLDYHAFPTSAALVAAPAADYRAAGLGWRGERVRAMAELLRERPPGWLAGLAALPYRAARAALVALPGVGPKIADCVCLFGLQRDEAVPVDTHVWALARQLFAAELGGGPRTLTPSVYERVLRLYQERYGAMAGWAQQYLYHWRRRGTAFTPVPSESVLAQPVQAETDRRWPPAGASR